MVSANMAFEQEWEQVKTELSKLANQTVCSIAHNEPSTILAVDAVKGLKRQPQKSGNVSWVSWDKIRGAYQELYSTCELRRDDDKRRYYGAFCRTVIARLTTATVVEDGRSKILRYVPDGKPPRLKES